MKNQLKLIALLCILPFLCIAQKDKNESTISIASSFNYFPEAPTYEFFVSFDNFTDDELILNFVTANSGTFVIEPGQTIRVDRSKTTKFPHQRIGLGTGVRIQKDNNLVHEISLTRFSIIKSSYLIDFLFMDGNEVVNRLVQGYEQKTGIFAVRYEIGKIFGRQKSNFRFGLVGGIEPTFQYYNRTNFSINDYPIQASLFSTTFSLIPTFTFKLGKKSFLDFKAISNLLVADFSESSRESIPFLPRSMQGGDLDLAGVTFAFALQFRYNIKEPKRRGRR